MTWCWRCSLGNYFKKESSIWKHNLQKCLEIIGDVEGHLSQHFLSNLCVIFFFETSIILKCARPDVIFWLNCHALIQRPSVQILRSDSDPSTWTKHSCWPTFYTPHVVNHNPDHFLFVWRQHYLEACQKVRDVFIHSHTGDLQGRQDCCHQEETHLRGGEGTIITGGNNWERILYWVLLGQCVLSFYLTPSYISP